MRTREHAWRILSLSLFWCTFVRRCLGEKYPAFGGRGAMRPPQLPPRGAVVCRPISVVSVCAVQPFFHFFCLLSLAEFMSLRTNMMPRCYYHIHIAVLYSCKRLFSLIFALRRSKGKCRVHQVDVASAFTNCAMPELWLPVGFVVVIFYWLRQVRQFQYLVSEDELPPEVLELRRKQRETEV